MRTSFMTAGALAMQLLTSACGDSQRAQLDIIQPRYTGGLVVEGEINIDPSAVSDVVSWVNTHPGTTGATQNVDPNMLIVQVTPTAFPCTHDGDDTTCLGQQTAQDDGSQLIQIAMQDMITTQPTTTIQTAALCHELWHIIVGDNDHTRADVWGPEGTVTTCYLHFKWVTTGTL